MNSRVFGLLITLISIVLIIWIASQGDWGTVLGSDLKDDAVELTRGCIALFIQQGVADITIDRYVCVSAGTYGKCYEFRVSWSTSTSMEFGTAAAAEDGTCWDVEVVPVRPR